MSDRPVSLLRNRSMCPRSGCRTDGSKGFALVAVLLAVAFMAGLVATYGRHVVVAGRSGMASPALLASREACHSGLTVTRQALVAGEGVVPSSIPTGDGLATVTVAMTPGGNHSVSVRSLGGDGLGARRTAEIALQPRPDSAPAGPASLPTLSAATVDALLADGSLALYEITTSQRIEDAELTGLLVVHAGVELQLADVVLHGAVISASVLLQVTPQEFDSVQAPRLLLDGDFRVDPPSALPGLAILMPDGVVGSGSVPARIQIHGDVVAHDVSLAHEGVLAGHVLAVTSALADIALLDRVGLERRPVEWSPALDLGGAGEPAFLAIVPASTSAGALSAIIDYWHRN
jgi:hypothetical protein